MTYFSTITEEELEKLTEAKEILKQAIDNNTWPERIERDMWETWVSLEMLIKDINDIEDWREESSARLRYEGF